MAVGMSLKLGSSASIVLTFPVCVEFKWWKSVGEGQAEVPTGGLDPEPKFTS